MRFRHRSRATLVAVTISVLKSPSRKIRLFPKRTIPPVEKMNLQISIFSFLPYAKPSSSRPGQSEKASSMLSWSTATLGCPSWRGGGSRRAVASNVRPRCFSCKLYYWREAVCFPALWCSRKHRHQSSTRGQGPFSSMDTRRTPPLLSSPCVFCSGGIQPDQRNFR